MAQPPEIERYRIPKSRVLNRRNINEYGLSIPSKRSANYEIPFTGTGPLLDFSTGLNYRKEARAKRNAAWANYQNKRANAAKGTNKKNANAKNNTRRTLFGGRRRTAKKLRCYN